ncbi:MAG: N-acetyltransferase family protein [Bdellovibrionota bacterium]
MEVRRLISADLDPYFALRLEMLRDSPDAFFVTYEDEKAKGSGFAAGILEKAEPGNAIFGAFEKGKIVGAAGVYRPDSRPKTVHKAMLWGMYVQPASRGRGIGEALVRAVVAHARDVMKSGVLQLELASQNRAARALYERVGFVAWGLEPKAWQIEGVYHQDLHMWLDLA